MSVILCLHLKCKSFQACSYYDAKLSHLITTFIMVLNALNTLCITPEEKSSSALMGHLLAIFSIELIPSHHSVSSHYRKCFLCVQGWVDRIWWASQITAALASIGWFEWKWPPYTHEFQCLVPRWWNCLWKIRRNDLVRGSVSLGAVFEVSKACTIPSWPSLCLVRDDLSGCERWPVASMPPWSLSRWSWIHPQRM